MLTIYLDISKKGPIPTVQAKQGEVGRKFRAVITDAGIPYTIPKDAGLSVWYSGDSGTGNYTHIGDHSAFETEGNCVVIEMISQMVAQEGRGTCCFIVNTKEGQQIGLWNIPYETEGIPGVDSEEAKQNYTAFSKDLETLLSMLESGKYGQAIADVAMLPTGEFDKSVFYRTNVFKLYTGNASNGTVEPATSELLVVVGTLPDVGQVYDDEMRTLVYYEASTEKAYLWEEDSWREVTGDIEFVTTLNGYVASGKLVVLRHKGVFCYRDGWVEVEGVSEKVIIAHLDYQRMVCSVPGDEIEKAIQNGKIVIAKSSSESFFLYRDGTDTVKGLSIGIVFGRKNVVATTIKIYDNGKFTHSTDNMMVPCPSFPENYGDVLTVGGVNIGWKPLTLVDEETRISYRLKVRNGKLMMEEE